MKLFSPLLRALFAICFLRFGLTRTEARLWRTTTGQSFEAEFIRVEGAKGIFLVKEKEYPYPLNYLSANDRLFIGKAVNQAVATATPEESAALTTPGPSSSPNDSALSLAGQPVKRGRETEIEIPMTDPAQEQEAAKAYGKPSDKARLLIALPSDFDPSSKACPLLIVSATADGAASSIGSAHQFVRCALEKGFGVLAVDGQFGKPPGSDSVDFRWALVSAALDAINRQWPQAKAWPIATGGVSGGAGYASYEAIKLAEAHAHLIGIFLAVSSWNPTRFPEELKKVAFSELRDLPIFLSAGENDEISSKALTDKSHGAMVAQEFKNVRFEHFVGGHQLNHPHLEAALDWFLKGAASPR